MSDKLFRISTPTIKYTIDDEFDMSRVASSRFIICNMGNKNRIVKENPVIEDMSFKVNLTQEETKKLNAGIISAQIHILLNNHKVIWTDIAKTTMNGVLGEDMFDVPDYSADTGEYEIDFHGTVSDYDVPLHGHLDVTLEGSTVIPNPEGEATDYLTKVEIDGEIFLVKDSTIHDWARAEEKPSYTKAEVGLGNVDNTSDLNKPVSTATQAALDLKADSSSVYTKTESNNLLSGKVDKVQGKGLSTNDYDDTAKGIVDGVTSALADKVDKVEGYGLSKNDYTDEEKAKVGEIDNKLDKTENAIRSDALAIISPVNDNAPYIYRQTPVKESFKALMKKIVGASVVWNQLGFGTGTSETNQYARLFKQTQGITVVDTIINHKYYISFVQPKGCAIYQQDRGNIGISYKVYNSPTTDTKIHIITSCTESTSEADISAMISKLETTEEAYNLTNCMFVDLTAMFGTTIADYVYTLETSQSGSGIAWLQSYGFFTEDYYAYTQNKLESGCVSAHKTYDGETLLTNTELSPITLRGLFKLSTDKLTVDGDEYNADGSVTRKYEQRAYQSGDESLANAITDGTNTIVKLATPTTEQTTPFTETEIVGSTEEFIDYEVAQSNRDVAIPVGTETDYYQEMTLPSLPTTSGNHNLIYNIATGFGWS